MHNIGHNCDLIIRKINLQNIFSRDLFCMTQYRKVDYIEALLLKKTEIRVQKA